MKRINLLLCGGTGTRLWPLSRRKLPKQFLKLFNGRSLFQRTLLRNWGLVDQVKVLINRDHYFVALEQVGELGLPVQEIEFLVEDHPRNTGPAVVLGGLASPEGALLLVTPSDHYLEGEEEYRRGVERGFQLAEEGWLVTFGVKPTSPATGYGYIESEGEEVKRFHEKPPLEKAKEYLKNPNFHWNSGMFLFRREVILEEFRRFNPELYSQLERVFQNRLHLPPHQTLFRGLEEVPALSIDTGVMEKSDRLKMVPVQFQWRDLGSFEELTQVVPSNQVLQVGEGRAHFLSTDPEKVLGVVGEKDLIVAETRDAILVIEKGRGQEIRELVQLIKQERPELLEEGNTIYRPWGYFQTLTQLEGAKVKRIVVNPGHQLSLQKHLHRSEVWIGLKGRGVVVKGEEELPMEPGVVVKIEKGELHRLRNPGGGQLEIVEVQFGEYLSEEDIIRVSDDYGRVSGEGGLEVGKVES
jgi:mannose-1-phosphate guanylyltransferase